MASRNATATQPAAAATPVTGTANIAANRTGTPIDPASIHGVRVPPAAVLRSDRAPTIGLSTTSHAFGSSRMRPAQPAGTPSVSVRKISSSSPGSAPTIPVPIEPIP